jgi:hypothetical protein
MPGGDPAAQGLSPDRTYRAQRRCAVMDEPVFSDAPSTWAIRLFRFSVGLAVVAFLLLVTSLLFT